MRLTKTMRALFVLFLLPLSLLAQVTTGTITGTIKDATGKVLQGATVEALHEPSGTKYKTASNATGKFNLPGLRVGGPYKVTVTYVGFKTETANDVWIQLGDPSVIEFSMSDAKTDLKEVTLTTTKKGALISKDRKGTSTNINSRLINGLPTTSRSVTDLIRLTPQLSGGNGFGATAFAGQDNRALNFTLDGSVFNNSFGLTALNGQGAGASPISLDALQEIQINLSPYSLREAGFTGANINAVTKSGTNKIHATTFYNFRNQSFLGSKAGAGGKEDVTVGTFDVKQFGISLGGPIIKDKLFYFANYEGERRVDPGTSWVANNSSNTVGGNVTSVKESDLISLSDFLASKLGYQTGAYQGYSYNTNSDKAVLRLDWNINNNHKLSIRGNLLRSHQDKQISNSGAIGGSRNSNTSMSYYNTSYENFNDITGVVAQLNSRFSNNVNNEIIFGYTANRDGRRIKGSPFPTIDIRDGVNSRPYITLGVDPFTPNNAVNTDTWQFSDNLTIYKGKHTISVGISYESFNFYNSFTPNIYGIYTFNSLNDFYTAANYYLANPNATTSPVALVGYQNAWSKLPGGQIWAASPKARNLGGYLQDEYDLNKDFRITYGVRFDVPFFANEAYRNTDVESLSFVNEKDEAIKLSTSKLPTYKIMVNPRVGFNYDVNGDKSVQVRGGLGLFTGRPPFVFVGNTFTNNGVTSGAFGPSFGDGVTSGPKNTQIPFNPNVPSNPIVGYGLTAGSYNIAPIQEDYKFPQIFRSNLAVDAKLSKDVIASAELMFTQNISSTFYYNANLAPTTTKFAGFDNRPRYGQVATGTLNSANSFGSTISVPSANFNRINKGITDATVMKSGPLGGSFMATLKLEKPIKAQGFGWMAAYNFGYTRDYIAAGSQAFSSWRDNKSVNGNNKPDIAFADNDVRSRLIANLNYRKEISKTVAVQFSLFYEGRNWGRFSYTYNGDMNGDGVPSNNDLLYIPTTAQVSQMKFENYSLAGVTQTQAMQQAAFENYIQQDKYLSSRRGEYAERNGVLMPTVNRFDFSAIVELSRLIGKDKHTLQLRADIFNIGNMFNSNSGVGYVINNSSPISFRAVDNTSGLPVFRMAAVNNSLNYTTYRKSVSINDVWQMQLGIRYTF